LGTRALQDWLALGLLAIALAFVGAWLVERRRRLRAEKMRAESQERLALVSSIASLGFWSWDAATDRVWASKHARGILALDDETALTSASLIAAIHPEDRPSVLRIINSSGSPVDTMEMELRVVGGGSEIRFVTAKACAYRDAKGAVKRVVGYVVDDGQRKRSAAELLKLQHKLKHLARVAMLGELSGALAHELQQPLTAILCNANAAQLLSNKDNLDVAELQETLHERKSDDKNAGLIIQRLHAH